MVSSFEISAIVILVLIIGLLILLNIVNWKWIQNSVSGSLYRSFNVPADGTSASSVTLKAPDGYEIKISKVFVGSAPAPHESDPGKCYSALRENVDCKMPTQVYPTDNSSLKSTVMSDKCDGKNSCTVAESDLVDIANSSGRNCNGTMGCIPYVFGVYECVKK